MPRSRARAEAVGHYFCPNPVHRSPVTAVIRRKSNVARTLYGYCYGTETEEGCGFTNWNDKSGQEFFLTHGKIWPGDPPMPPADLPACVRNNNNLPPREWAASRLKAKEGREAPAPVPEPLPAPAPEPRPVPEPPEPPAPTKKKGFRFPFEIDE